VHGKWGIQRDSLPKRGTSIVGRGFVNSPSFSLRIESFWLCGHRKLRTVPGADRALNSCPVRRNNRQSSFAGTSIIPPIQNKYKVMRDAISVFHWRGQIRYCVVGCKRRMDCAGCVAWRNGFSTQLKAEQKNIPAFRLSSIFLCCECSQVSKDKTLPRPGARRSSAIKSHGRETGSRRGIGLLFFLPLQAHCYGCHFRQSAAFDRDPFALRSGTLIS